MSPNPCALLMHKILYEALDLLYRLKLAATKIFRCALHSLQVREVSGVSIDSYHVCSWSGSNVWKVLSQH